MQKSKAKDLIFNRIAVLPTLPQIVHKIITLVEEEDTSAKELGALIANDQAITTRLLKVANSAYYGFMLQIETLQKAVVVLGYEEVKSLAMGIAVFHSLRQTNQKAGLDPEQFWLHSLGSALIGQDISRRFHADSPGAAFTASLLHDVGKLVISSALPEEYGGVFTLAQSQNTDLSDAEREVLGFDHTEAGVWVCEKWKLPPVLTVPIHCHHRVLESTKELLRMTAIVHSADSLCNKSLIGHSGADAHKPVQEAALSVLRIDDEGFQRLLEPLSEHKTKAFALLHSLH